MSIGPRAKALLEFDAALAREGVKGEVITIGLDRKEYEQWVREAGDVPPSNGATWSVRLYGPANLYIVRENAP